MRVFIFGSSQYRHVSEIFKNIGITVKNPIKCNSIIYNRLINFLINFLKIIICKYVYCIGGGNYKNNKLLRVAKILRKRVIVHWIGTDVLIAKEEYKKNRIPINQDIINLAGSEQLCKELTEIGVFAFNIPIVPIELPYPKVEMPKKHRILVYLPPNRVNFYGGDIVKKLATTYSDIPFHIVANNGDGMNWGLNNVFFEGALSNQKMIEMYGNCSILFRYPEHDGLSLMVLEALAMGRTVIYKYNFPYVVTPKDSTELSIFQCFDSVISKEPIINEEAVEYINTHYSIDRVSELYKKIIT